MPDGETIVICRSILMMELSGLLQNISRPAFCKLADPYRFLSTGPGATGFKFFISYYSALPECHLYIHRFDCRRANLLVMEHNTRNIQLCWWTSATSQSPHVRFAALGNYTIAWLLPMPQGSNTNTKTNYITVNSANSDFSGVPDNSCCWKLDRFHRCFYLQCDLLFMEFRGQCHSCHCQYSRTSTQ